MSLLLVDPALRAAHIEIANQTDRGAAIIACGILDDVIAALLKRRLLLTSKLTEELFNHEKNGPLSTFRNKINVGFAVGLYKPKLRNDLHLIRRIRNRFAHKIDPLKFSDTKIATWCSSLQTARPNIKRPRKRFLYVAFGASSVLMTMARVDIRLTELLKQTEFRASIAEASDQIHTEFLAFMNARHSS